MHNGPNHCFKILAFSKENNILHFILQYGSTLFAEFIVKFLQVFEKVSILRTYRSNNFNIKDFIRQITQQSHHQLQDAHDKRQQVLQLMMTILESKLAQTHVALSGPRGSKYCS